MAHATQPCRQPTKESFIATTIKPATLIAKVKIKSAFLPFLKKEGTSLKVLELFYNSDKISPGDTIQIPNWNHYRPPLYLFKTGSDLIVYLKKIEGTNYAFTNLTWKSCTPSLSWEHEEYGIPKGYQDETQWHSRLEFSEFVKSVSE